MLFQKIANEIISMGNEDQTMRNGITDGTTEWDVSIDVRNTKRMKEIVEQIGWPTKIMVGEEASNIAWLLVQHADHDPVFQHACLDLMKKLSDTEIKIRNIAYLEDRVRLNENRPQLYGTQFFGEGETYGPRPIFEIEHIEERRKQMGMEPFAEYAERMKKFQMGFKK